MSDMHVGRGTWSRALGPAADWCRPACLHTEAVTSAPHWRPEAGRRSG